MVHTRDSKGEMLIIITRGREIVAIRIESLKTERFRTLSVLKEPEMKQDFEKKYLA